MAPPVARILHAVCFWVWGEIHLVAALHGGQPMCNDLRPQPARQSIMNLKPRKTRAHPVCISDVVQHT